MNRLFCYLLLSIPLLLQCTGVLFILLLHYFFPWQSVVVALILCCYTPSAYPRVRHWYATNVRSMMQSITCVQSPPTSMAYDPFNCITDEPASYLFVLMRAARSEYMISPEYIFPIFAYTPDLYPSLFINEESIQTFQLIHSSIQYTLPLVRNFMKWIGVQFGPPVTTATSTGAQHMMIAVTDDLSITQMIQLACIHSVIVQPILITQKTPSSLSVLTHSSFPTLQLNMCSPIDCRVSQKQRQEAGVGVGGDSNAWYKLKKKEFAMNTNVLL